MRYRERKSVQRTNVIMCNTCRFLLIRVRKYLMEMPYLCLLGRLGKNCDENGKLLPTLPKTLNVLKEDFVFNNLHIISVILT